MLPVLAGLILSLSVEAKIYLKLDGIKGESTAEGYVDWIELSSMQFGVGRGISMEAGALSNREATRPSFSEVLVQKESGLSSAALFREATTAGGAVKPAELHITKLDTNETKVIPYCKLTLTDSLLSGYSFSADGVSVPQETLSIAYTKIEEVLTAYTRDGSPDREATVWYDLAKALGGGTGSSGAGTDNLAPNLSPITAKTTAEDTPITVSFTVADPDGFASALILSASSSNAVLLPASRISLAGSGTARTVLLSPVANQYGSTSVEIAASDGSKTASTIFTLTVTPQNDAPIISAPSGIQLISGVRTPLSGISVNDVDAGTLPLRLSATVTQGTLHTNGAVGGVTANGLGFSYVELEGGVRDLNSLLGRSEGLLYQNYPGFNGIDTLTLTLDDLSNSGAGGAADHTLLTTLQVFASVYAQWQYLYFESDLGNADLEVTRWGDTADSDGDGIPNLLEYALGLNPNLADAGDGPRLVSQQVDADLFYAVEFTRYPDPDVEVFVEVCSDLIDGTWSSASTEILQNRNTLVNGMEQLIFRDVHSVDSSSNRFYRIGARHRR